MEDAVRLVSTGITPRREPWFAVLLMALLAASSIATGASPSDGEQG